MDGLCKERLITKEACDWVKYALDPFHDLQLEHLRGYPDVSTEPTVIVKIRQAVTVTAPPGLADTGSPTWDCHVVASPRLHALGSILGVSLAGVPARRLYPFLQLICRGR